jgi:hypothetical protein
MAAVPAFPGAAKTFLTLGLWAIFQTKVCSLPPPPTTSIFIYLTSCIPLSFKGEGEENVRETSLPSDLV